jgi:hypothetical protein
VLRHSDVRRFPQPLLQRACGLLSQANGIGHARSALDTEDISASERLRATGVKLQTNCRFR